VFHELAKNEVVQMVDLMLKRLSTQLEGQGLGLELTAAAKEHLADKGYDPQLGARPLRRAIQRLIEDALSEKILYKQFRAGEIIVVDTEDDPDRPGDQPFDDGTYTVLFREEELGGIVVQSDVLQEVFGGPCVEALVAERSRRSSRKSGGKGESITGSRSNRLQALPGSGDMDVITGTSGPDVYRLGDQSGAFRALHGNRDYVRIAEFGPDDRLVLHGDSADYSQSGPLILDGHAGYALSFRGDPIALIQGGQAGGAFDSSGLSAAQISYI